MTKNIDLDALQALAEAATQGEWELCRHGVIKAGPLMEFTNGSARKQIVMTTGAEWMREGEQYNNAAYIAAANPQTILALIDMARRATTASGVNVPDDALKREAQAAFRLAVRLAVDHCSDLWNEGRNADDVISNLNTDFLEESMAELAAAPSAQLVQEQPKGKGNALSLTSDDGKVRKAGPVAVVKVED